MASSPRIEELRRKYEENPRRYFAPLANEYRKVGDLQQAIAICREHLTGQPPHMSGNIVFGQALFEAGEHAEARGVFEAALGLDPENLIALRHLGDIARAGADAGEARRWYERVLEVDPRNEDIVALIRGLDDLPAAASAADTSDVTMGGDGTSVIAALEFEATSFGTPSGAPASVEPSIAEPAGFESSHSTPIDLGGAVAPGGGDASTDAAPEPADAAVPTTRPDLDALIADAPPFEATPREATPASPLAEPTDFTAGFPFDAEFGGTSLPDASLIGDDANPSGAESLLAEGRAAPEPDSPLGDLAARVSGFVAEDEPHLLSGAQPMIPDEDVPSPLAGIVGNDRLDTESTLDAAMGMPDESYGFAPEPPLPPPPAAPAFEPFEAPEVPPVRRASDAVDAVSDAVVPTPVVPTPVSITPVVPTPIVPTPVESTPVADAAPDADNAIVELPPATPFVTETMAELFAAQGKHAEAADVYRQLLAQRPEDAVLAERLAAVEAIAAGSAQTLGALLGRLAQARPVAGGAEMAAAASAAVVPQVDTVESVEAYEAVEAYASVETYTPVDTFAAAVEDVTAGASALAALFGPPTAEDEAAARALAALFAAPPAEGTTDPSSGGVVPPGEPIGGAPTQPAADELSLSQVFGAPAASTATPRGTASVAFDQFFATGGSRPTTPAADPDIAEFNAWLEGLKKK
jgi:tetratricopeptide (TPR) repeat protein